MPAFAWTGNSTHCVTTMVKPITHPSNTTIYLYIWKSAMSTCTHFGLWSCHQQAVCKNQTVKFTTKKTLIPNSPCLELEWKPVYPKHKAIQLQAWREPYSSGTVRFPELFLPTTVFKKQSIFQFMFSLSFCICIHVLSYWLFLQSSWITSCICFVGNPKYHMEISPTVMMLMA
jgi:hypothetical protein